jgi:1,2-dihydroxy-3-keto-5-methylthiopentene dioxygenase
MPVLAVFDTEGSWRDTHVCDGWITECLARQGVAWGREDDAPEGQRVLDRAALFYVRAESGYLGLLFEAGEWVSLPAGEPLQPLPAALPHFDAFVEHVLMLTGNDAAEED